MSIDKLKRRERNYLHEKAIRKLIAQCNELRDYFDPSEIYIPFEVLFKPTPPDPIIAGSYHTYNDRNVLYYSGASEDELAYMRRINPHLKFIPLADY